MKPSKYHAKTSMYNGYNYDSKKEAEYAMQLDWLIKAKEIKSWERQFKIDIIINGIHICNYFIDFKVIRWCYVFGLPAPNCQVTTGFKGKLKYSTCYTLLLLI
jgi:Protein of unknown function (DUF1064)